MTAPAWVSLGVKCRADREPIKRACLFIDVDGTLLDFVDRPEKVKADRALIALLQELVTASDGAVALISGRSLAALDTIFAPLQLPAAGVHGFERRGADNCLHRHPIRLAYLNWAREHLGDVVRMYPGLQLEDKGHALALHFRRAPEAEAQARSAMDAVESVLRPDFELLNGNQVLEIKPSGHNKATAVEAFLGEAPFQGRLPVYLGDDVTDLDGFEAVRRHRGVDIAVGGRVSARWALAGPAAAREWLTNLLMPRAAAG